MPKAPLIVCVGVWLAVATAAAEPGIKGTWLEARSSNFHVISDAHPEKVRALTEKLERFHQAMEQSFLGPQAHPVIPSTLILMKSGTALRPFWRLSPEGRPVAAEGFMQPGPERMYLAVNLGAATPEETAFHEYTHLLVKLKFGSLPLWLNEGLATYFAGVRLEGTRFVLGEWRPDCEKTLRETGFIPLHVLMDVDADSPYYNAGSRRQRFYAESWLLVHYLFYADLGLHRPRLQLFIELLRDHVPQEDALLEVFGLNYASLESRLRRYHEHHSFSLSYGELGVVDSKVPVEVAPLSVALAQVYLADLWLNAGRVEEARKLLERVSDSSVPPAEGLLRLGRIELEENRPLAAEKYFQSALVLHPEDYRLWYYAARAISEGRGSALEPPEARLTAARDIIQLLAPVVGAAGQFPEAQRLLRQAELIRRNEEWLEQVRKQRRLSQRDTAP